MTLFFLAIASFLAVGVFVVWLIADTRESRSVPHQRDVASVEPFLLSISEAFDPIHSILWQAPIAAFELIDTGGESGIPITKLRPIYDEAARRFPEIYEGYGFVCWLQFLEEMRLISWDGSHVVLTPEGHAFLRFRFVTDAMVQV
jgi:hypothetical protein